MTLRAELSLQLAVLLVLLVLQCSSSRAADDTWVAQLDRERNRIQVEIDYVVKYICPHDQSDHNCRIRLPMLREELRLVDQELRSRNYVQVAPQKLPQDPLSLIRSRNFVQAEQELLRNEDDVEAVVKAVYDKRVENFNLLANFASAVRDGGLKFIVYKNLLEEIIRQGHDDPIKVVRVIRGLQDEVVLGSSIDDETLAKATNMVDSLKLLFESAVAKLWIESNINHFFERDVDVPALADEISILDSALFTRIISKVVTGAYPLVETDQLMRNMEKLHLVPQLIDAYTAVYNEMARFGDINGKRYILKLGYYFRELLVRSNFTRLQLEPEKRTQLLIMEQRLPTSIRSLIFAERVCLKSKYVHDYLHIAHGHPRLRRYAILAPGTQLKWKIRHFDYSIYFEFPYGGFLYADDDNFDGHNRLVAASQDSKDMIVGSEWKIEPLGDDCFIRNTAYNELLYVSDEFDEEHLSNRVFTAAENPASVASDDRFKWTIEAC